MLLYILPEKNWGYMPESKYWLTPNVPRIAGPPPEKNVMQNIKLSVPALTLHINQNTLEIDRTHTEPNACEI